ncbi:Stress responsive A/B Barrel Domain protein [compost metagenome]
MGTDITPVSLAQGFTHAFTIDFQDQGSRDGYWEDPGHIAVAEQLLPLLPQGTDDMVILQIPLVTA